MRTCTGPSSSTVLAPTRRPQLLMMVLHNLLWCAASPEMRRAKDLGSLTRLTRHARPLGVEGRSWTGRSRRSRIGGNDFSLPLAQGKCGRPCAGKGHQRSRTPVRGSTVSTRPKSSAYTFPICRRSEQQRRAEHCAFMEEGICCSAAAIPPGSPSCLTWRPMSSWHVPEPGAPTSGHRPLVPIARLWVKPCIGKRTSRP